MTVDQILIKGESAQEFIALQDSFIAEYKPAGFLEKMLVENLAQHYWFIQRAVRLQNSAFSDSPVGEKQRGVLFRYQCTHEQSFNRSFTTLMKLRSDSLKERIGFESQKAKLALCEAKIQALEARTSATNLMTESLKSREGAIVLENDAKSGANERRPYLVKPVLRLT